MKIGAISLVAIIVLQGCSSSSAPSVSDVEKALEAQYQGCDKLEVDNVKIVNGRAVNDQVHEESITYDLKVTPIPEDRAQAFKAANEANAAEQQQINQTAEQRIARREEIEHEISHLGSQVEQAALAKGLEPGTPEFDQFKEKLAGQTDLPKLNAEYKALKEASADRSNAYPKTQRIDSYKEWGTPECINKIGTKTAEDTIKAVTEGALQSFQGTMTMEKTDNGWQATQ